MKLKIKSEEPPEHSNEYEVEITFFSGDLDDVYYESFFFESEEEVIELLQELQKLNGTGKRNYYRPERIYNCEDDEEPKVNTPSKLINDLFSEGDEDWPIDTHCGDYSMYAALYQWEVFYWNEQGRRIDVEIVK